MRFRDMPKGVHMKKIVSRLLIMVSVLLMLLACNLSGGTESPPDNNLIMSTDLPAITDTPYPTPLATQAGCNFGNNISVPISSNAPCIAVTRNSKVLTISSTDGKSHTCTFTGNTNVTVSIQQGKTSSVSFQLDGYSDYTLKCDNLPASVKISGAYN